MQYEDDAVDRHLEERFETCNYVHDDSMFNDGLDEFYEPEVNDYEPAWTVLSLQIALALINAQDFKHWLGVRQPYTDEFDDPLFILNEGGDYRYSKMVEPHLHHWITSVKEIVQQGRIDFDNIVTFRCSTMEREDVYACFVERRDPGSYWEPEDHMTTIFLIRKEEAYKGLEKLDY